MTIDRNELVHTLSGELRLDARAAYRDGMAMLTVYGFRMFSHLRPTQVGRVVLHRVFVPSNTPKAEKAAMLIAMCDLVTVQYGVAYKLRSKAHVKVNQQEKQP